MKVNISLTFELTPEQVKDLVTAAKSSGFDYDGTTDKRKLIKKYLKSQVENTIYYIHEKVDK